MGRYYHLFETEAAQDAARNDRTVYNEPWLGYCRETGKCSYNKLWPDSVANCYEYVDLGLPSGNLWATMNIGATSITEQGSTFEWGGIFSKTTTNSWTGYRFGGKNKTADTLTKYNATDGLITLELVDDAARIQMGGLWQMPTKEDFSELTYVSPNGAVSYTTRSEETVDGVTCTVLTSKANGNKLYFPRKDTGYYSVWTASRHPTSNGMAFVFHRTSESDKWYDCLLEDSVRYNIYPVRGIIKRPVLANLYE